MKQVLVLFVTGFFLGPIGDFAHVKTQTTTYPSDYGLYFFGLPFWVPFLFGTAAVAVGVSHPAFDKILGPNILRPGAKTLGRVIGGLALFLGSYCLSGLLPPAKAMHNDLMLALIALGTWAILDWTWQGIILGILTAVVGSLTEIILVHLGFFSYLPPKNNLWGVASWLPWLYFTASVSVGNLGRYLSKENEHQEN
jgi:hypothetical protein